MSKLIHGRVTVCGGDTSNRISTLPVHWKEEVNWRNTDEAVEDSIWTSLRQLVTAKRHRAIVNAIGQYNSILDSIEATKAGLSSGEATSVPDTQLLFFVPVQVSNLPVEGHTELVYTFTGSNQRKDGIRFIGDREDDERIILRNDSSAIEAGEDNDILERTGMLWNHGVSAGYREMIEEEWLNANLDGAMVLAVEMLQEEEEYDEDGAVSAANEMLLEQIENGDVFETWYNGEVGANEDLLDEVNGGSYNCEVLSVLTPEWLRLFMLRVVNQTGILPVPQVDGLVGGDTLGKNTLAMNNSAVIGKCGTYPDRGIGNATVAEGIEAGWLNLANLDILHGSEVAIDISGLGLEDYLNRVATRLGLAELPGANELPNEVGMQLCREIGCIAVGGTGSKRDVWRPSIARTRMPDDRELIMWGWKLDEETSRSGTSLKSIVVWNANTETQIDQGSTTKEAVDLTMEKLAAELPGAIVESSDNVVCIQVPEAAGAVSGVIEWLVGGTPDLSAYFGCPSAPADDLLVDVGFEVRIAGTDADMCQAQVWLIGVTRRKTEHLSEITSTHDLVRGSRTEAVGRIRQSGQYSLIAQRIGEAVNQLQLRVGAVCRDEERHFDIRGSAQLPQVIGDHILSNLAYSEVGRWVCEQVRYEDANRGTPHSGAGRFMLLPRGSVRRRWIYTYAGTAEEEQRRLFLGEKSFEEVSSNNRWDTEGLELLGTQLDDNSIVYCDCRLEAELGAYERGTTAIDENEERAPVEYILNGVGFESVRSRIRNSAPGSRLLDIRRGTRMDAEEGSAEVIVGYIDEEVPNVTQ